MNRYDLAVQGAGNGLWDWDLTNSRVHYSSGWISLLGGAAAEFGTTVEEWFKRVHPEDFEFVQREINSLIVQDASQFEIQHRMLHHDGCYRWMVCRGVITRDSTGRALRVSGCHIDVTAEKVVDELTGLPNRLLLQDRLARSVEKAKRQNDFLFAVLIVDLDLFQSGINRLETINADRLVVAAARRLESSLRSDASSVREGRVHLVARSAGEEFTVLLDGLRSPSEAKSIADQLLNEMLAPFDFNGQEVFLSPSIGLSLSATGYENADEALRDADTALYRAKSFGKSRCEVFDTAVLESTRARNQLERDLREALSRNEFEVFYQPIISLPENRIAGFEALVRWNHPTRGMVFPNDFIPAAEKTGLILPLDKWVLREACRQLRSWRKNPAIPTDLWISVNLSGMQLKHSSLLEGFREILDETGLDASGLLLELTEGTVIKNPEAARTLLMQLRVMGAKIALDDFGTGYSSLAHLRRFPLDYLKIDRSFIKCIRSADGLEIVRAITVMADQLGLHVIAEGIETTDQLDLLRPLHCEYGQGFLFSKAIAAHEAEQLLLNGFASGASCPERDVRTNSVSNPIPVSRSGKNKFFASLFRSKRGLVFLALPILILLLMGGLLARLNRFTSPPVAYTSPQIGPVKAPELENTAPMPKPPEALPVQKNRELPKTILPSKAPAPPKAAKTKPKELMATYPVVHDHVLGSCRGELIIREGHISFASEKEKDSFDIELSNILYDLDKDQLILKAGSRVFRFKSADAPTDEGNKARLLEIFQTISRISGK